MRSAVRTAHGSTRSRRSSGRRTCGTRSPRGRSRRSSSSSARSGSSRGCGCSTSAAGRAGTRWRSPGAGSTVHGVDLSPGLRRARARAAADAERAPGDVRGARRARARGRRRSTTPRSACARAGSGCSAGTTTTAIIERIARAVRPGGAVAVTAFSAAFAIRWLEDGEDFDPRTGRAPRARDGAQRGGRGAGLRPLDHLLHRPGAGPAGPRGRARRRRRSTG